MIIARLKREVAELKAELVMLKGGEGVKESLTAEDIDRCNKMVEDFVETQDPMKQMGVVSDRLMINQCFYHFKHLYRDMLKKVSKGGKGGGAELSGPNFGNAPMASPAPKGEPGASSKEVKMMESEMQRLQALVQQRDNEIAILLSHVNKKAGGGQGDFGSNPGIPL